jgi:diguanylate cyclase (GGDEF)-like protein
MKRSVALETNLFVALTIVLMVLVGVFGKHILSNHDRDMARQDAQRSLGTYELALQRQISFYQRLLEGLARRLDVHELLEFGEQEGAFLWAANYRKLLPDTVGLSLVNRDGEIQGNPDTLLIGPKCRADIVNLSQGKNIFAPAVHRERAGLEHFDLFAPVNNVDGERLGYLFASFEITVIQDLLDAMTHNGHILTVLAADNTPIASIERLSGKAEDVFELTRPVSSTDWFIVLKSQSGGREGTYTTLQIAATILALFVGIGVVLLSRHLSRGLLREIFSIRTALDRIAEGSDMPIDIQPRFSETASLMNAVQDVSNRIQTQKETLRQLSETDSLTGLLNRRRFSKELEKAWALANRKVNVYVMMLDVDDFKQINDQQGHVAGDQVLKIFADCLNDCSRSTDVVTRMGGDEFAMLLIHSDEAAGLELYKRLCICFREAQTKQPNDAGLYCTLSAGLVKLDPEIDAEAEACLRRSDEALYRAKQGGKNQIQS